MKNNLKYFLAFNFVLFLGIVFSQDISGEWKTRSSNGFYAELHLIDNGNGNYTGNSFDEQAGGYCSYSLVGTYNIKRNKFSARNTDIIRKTPNHFGSNYTLRYEKDDVYEYLVGYVQVQTRSNPFSMGGFPQASPNIPVRYYRSYKDPIKENNQKEEDIVFNEKAVDIPEPKDIPLPVEEKEELTGPTPLPIPQFPKEEKEPVVVVKEKEPVKPTPTIEKPVVVTKEDEPKKPVVVIKPKEDIPEEYEATKLKELKEERKDVVVAEYNYGRVRKFKLKIRDYGEEDNDVISVFLDDEVVVKNLKISKKSDVFNLKITPKKVHKLTFVANNLGEIPPNTCTVSFTFGGKTYVKKLFTDEEVNAVIILNPN